MCEFHSSGIFILLREVECSSCYFELDYIASSEIKGIVLFYMMQLNIRLWTEKLYIYLRSD